MVRTLDNPKDTGEWVKMLELPLVLKFGKRGEVSYFIMDNGALVYDDPSYPASFDTPTIVKYRKLHLLARKHGRSLPSEEFERGAIAPSFTESRDFEANLSVSEYRFQAAT